MPETAIVDRLAKDLERLSTSLPWVAGQIVNEGASEGNTGVFKIKAFEKSPRLDVKDLRDDPSAPTMNALRSAKFPISMLDEDVVTNRRTLPGGPGYSSTAPEPVLVLQVTFIVGGLLLSINGHHATMDMTGQGEVIRLLSVACRREEFTSEEVSTGNFARDTVIPFLDDSWKPGPEFEYQIVKAPTTPAPEVTPQPQPNPAKARWANFSFSIESLASLKATALQSIPPGTSFVSTDDALSAFQWQSITRVRFSRCSPDTKTTSPVQWTFRQQVGAPKAYPGFLQNMTYNRCTFEQLVNEPLGAAAARLRSWLDPKDLRFHAQATAAFLSRTPDKRVFSVNAKLNPPVDVSLSSWVKVDYCYDLDFGLGLGNPESVRRPQFTPLESLLYLLPKAPDGEIAVAACLREEDMERLRKDEEFMKYGKFIG
ncbi:Fc.00g011250.m01.CDS01 [Cosmosporella sp. VM-42]